VPLSEQPGVIRHGPTGAELFCTYALWADCVAPSPCQGFNPGLPLMVPAAFMNAAWAAQPDLLTASMGEICRHLAQVAGGVPHALNDLVVRVCHSFLPPFTVPYACIECSG